MNKLSRGHPRGLVLILVLGAIAILSVLAVEIHGRSQRDVLCAASTTRETKFRQAFKSGLAVAQGILAERRLSKGYDSWRDGWQQPLTIKLDETCTVSILVADESGKLSLRPSANSQEQTGHAQKQLDRLFDYLVREDPDREAELGKTKAAIAARLGWAKDGTAPTTPLPLASLDGLREAGLSAHAVFGYWPLDQRYPTPSLSDHLTVFGDGKLNLNTAEKAVFFSLDRELDAALASQIVQWRGTPDAEPDTLRAFKQVKDLELVEGIVLRHEVNGRPVVLRNLCAKLTPFLSVQSRCFSARIRAVVDGRVRQAWAFFEPVDVQAASSAPRLIAFEEIEP